MTEKETKITNDKAVDAGLKAFIDFCPEIKITAQVAIGLGLALGAYRDTLSHQFSKKDSCNGENLMRNKINLLSDKISAWCASLKSQCLECKRISLDNYYFECNNRPFCRESKKELLKDRKQAIKLFSQAKEIINSLLERNRELENLDSAKLKKELDSLKTKIKEVLT
jgi:hypothetical protein